MEEFKREIQTYQNHFWDFYDKQNPIVQKKIDWTIDLIKVLKIVPKTYFKYLTDTDGLWEIRIKAGNGIFRIFCFFDDANLVLLLNAFQKKTQKTPKTEIQRAQRLKKEYYENK